MMLQISFRSTFLDDSEVLLRFSAFAFAKIILDENYQTNSSFIISHKKSIVNDQPITVKQVVDLVQHALQHRRLR